VTLTVQAADEDPHVLAAVHMVSGFGSSQMYLLAAWAMVPLAKRTVVAITAL
jgi:uncharacterized membrane protein